MQTKQFKLFMLFFSLLLIIGNVLAVQPVNTHADEGKHKATIQVLDDEDNTLLSSDTLAFESGDSAYDGLRDAADKQNSDIEADMTDNQLNITTIDEATFDQDSEWTLTVNNSAIEEAPDQYELKDGDSIVFKVESADRDDIIDDEATDSDEPSNHDESHDDSQTTSSNVTSEQQQNLDQDDEEDQTAESEQNDSERDETSDQAQPSKQNTSVQKETITDQKQANKTQEAQVFADQTTDEPIKDLLNYVDENIELSYGSEWWIWGLANTDYDISDSYIDSVKQEVKDEEGELRGLETQKVIMALSLLGEDATDVAGYDLIENMTADYSGTGINDYVYSLLAVDSGAYKAEGDFRDTVIEEILEDEIDSGGWAFFGDDATVDITAMVLAALAPYQDDAEVSAATDRAVDYLSEAQENNGGFYEKFNGGDSSESVSQVIVALSELGIDPTGERFTKENGNLLDHLHEFKQTDGGYAHTIDDDSAMAMSSSQALLAYVAHDNFKSGGSSVYKGSLNGGEGSSGNEDEFNANEHIDNLLNYVDEQNVNLEYGSEWWIWSLAHTNYPVPDNYIDSVKQEVKDTEAEFRSLELQKIIIALSLLEEDATDIAGYNLIDQLADDEFNTGINGYIYGLLAVDSGEYETPNDFRGIVISHILDKEKDGGGWALFGDDPTVDITAMALAALAPYQDDAEVNAAIDRAVAYLSEVQENNGGFYEEFNGGDSSESVSQVIIALSELGIDPTNQRFTKEGGNLLEHLESFRRDDDGYRHLPDDDYSFPMSTQQALLAYVAYDKFKSGEGSVYQPITDDSGDESDDEVDEDKPTPDDPEDPEKDDDDSEKNTKDQDNNDNDGSTTQTTNDNTSDNNNQKEAMTSNDDGDKLPQTATSMFNSLLIGIILLITAAAIVLIRKRYIHNA